MKILVNQTEYDAILNRPPRRGFTNQPWAEYVSENFEVIEPLEDSDEESGPMTYSFF